MQQLLFVCPQLPKKEKLRNKFFSPLNFCHCFSVVDRMGYISEMLTVIKYLDVGLL